MILILGELPENFLGVFPTLYCGVKENLDMLAHLVLLLPLLIRKPPLTLTELTKVSLSKGFKTGRIKYERRAKLN